MGNQALQSRSVHMNSVGHSFPFSLPLSAASWVTGWAFFLPQKHSAPAVLEAGRNLFQVPLVTPRNC